MPFSASLFLAQAKEDSACQDSRATDPPFAFRRMEAAEFQAFYAVTAPALRGYIRRTCGEDALADDILQETFLRFLRADLSVPVPGSALEDRQLKAYLYKIAASLVCDHWRRVRRERRWSWIFGGPEPAEAPDYEGERMRLFRALKAQEQLLLWLAYVEEFEHREIAAALGVKEKSVRVLLFRARRRLAGILEKAGLGGRNP